jgi:hypothetical protein
MEHLDRRNEPLTLAAAEPQSDRALRRLLGVDAVTCFVAGLVLLSVSGRIGGWMRLDSAAPVAVVGIGLVLYSQVLALGARTSGRGPERTATVTAGLDAAWVAGSLVLVVMVSMPAWLGLVVVLQAGAVAGFAYGKYRLLRG